MNPSDISKIIQAIRVAAQKHANQREKDGRTPYINHSIEVADILWNVGEVHDTTVLTAAVLHDLLEKTETPPEEIRKKFDDDVYSLVVELTYDPSLPESVRRQRKIDEAANKSPKARTIKLADKISNVSNLMLFPPQGWDKTRKLEYIDWAEQVVARMKGTNDKLEKKFAQICDEVRESL